MKLRTKFQDEDFELGEVVTADIATMPDGRIKLQAAAKKGGLHTIFYDKLENLYSEWEDYEEPERYYYITSGGEITHRGFRLWENESVYDKKRKEIGNYFGTEEEAKKAVEKLKAWKRLSENKYLFGRLIDLIYSLNANSREFDEYLEDIELLFGGEK